jgi:hypothetical protein
MMGIVLLIAVTTSHPKSAIMSTLSITLTSGNFSVRELMSFNKTPINSKIMMGSVGILRFTELYLSSMRCTDSGVENARKYSRYFGLWTPTQNSTITAGAAKDA